jgi:glutamyl-tRNA reductase
MLVKDFFLLNIDGPVSDSSLVQFESDQSIFIMKTCQRILILADRPITYHLTIDENSRKTVLKNKEAYTFVIEMLCGLKSRLIAENEIVHQFKKELTGYLLNHTRSKTLIILLQKMLQDSKKIRENHLKGISQKTYAALTRKIVKKQAFELNIKNEEIIIFGSGKLAIDLIGQFKKTRKIYLCARNEQVVNDLCFQHSIGSIKWENIDRTNHFQFFVNTIGTQNIIFSKNWLKKLRHDQNVFIDLASPSPVSNSVREIDNVTSFDLDDIFALGGAQKDLQEQKINRARNDILDLSKKRIMWFEQFHFKKNEFLASSFS